MTSEADGLPVVFVVPGDLHLTEAGLENHGVACKAVEEVNRLIRPDFVQFIGDNVQDAKEQQFRLFKQLAHDLEMPHFALIGDHDRDGSATPDGFIKHIGEPYGSFKLRGFRFVRLNSQEQRPVGFSNAQLDWLESEFTAAEVTHQRVVLFQHNYPYKVFEQFAGPGIDRWRQIVDARRPVAILCGHTHYEQIANDGRNVSVATRSIGDPEGGPPGYLIGVVYEDDLALKYRAVDEGNAVALITHPRSALLATRSTHIVRGPDAVRVRTWSTEPLARVQFRLDGKGWYRLEPVSPGSWSGPLLTYALSKGEHAIEVAAVDQFGNFVARESIVFIFDPTGRYTPIPRVHPDIKSTSFC